MKSKLFCLSLVAVLALAFTACGGTATPAAPAAPPADAAAPEPAPEAAVPETGAAEAAFEDPEPGVGGTIELWSMFTGADGDTFDGILDRFNATNPDFTLIYRPMEAGDLYLRLALAVASGEGIPDIAMNHVERIPMFAMQGAVTDLSPFYANAGISPSDFNAKAWSMTEIGGGHFGIPLDVHSWILWANMDIIDELGLNVLSDGTLTWDDFFSIAPAVVDAGYIPFGLSWDWPSFMSSFPQLGGVLSEDGRYPIFNNDIAYRVVNHYRSMVEMGFTQQEGVSAWDEFFAGNILFFPYGVWALNAVNASESNIQPFNFPVFDRANIGHWTSAHFFTVPTDPNREDERVYAALEAIQFVVENSIDWAMAGLVLTHVEASRDPVFQTLPQAWLADQNEELLISDYLFYGFAMDAISRVLTDMFWGHLDISEGLSRAQQEIRDSIEMGGY